MIPLFNAIILDVAVVAILLIIIVVSVSKGIMHTLINFALLAGSIALSFAPFMMIVKNPIIDLLSNSITLGVGIADEIKLGVYLIYPFAASVILTLVIYLILRIFKVLICLLIKKRMLKDNKLPKRKGIVSRILGGVFGLILYGVVVVFALSIFNKPLVGGDKTLKEGYVAKHIESLDDMVASLLVDEKDFETFEGTVIIKILKGDIYSPIVAKVEGESEDTHRERIDECVEDIVVLGNMVSDGGLVIEDLDDIKNQVNHLHHFLRFVTIHALDDNGLEVDGFEKVVEISRNVVTKAVNDINTLHGDSTTPLDVGENTIAIAANMKVLGLEDIAKLFEDIVVSK